MKVSDILRVKGGTLFTASPDQALGEAVNAMAERVQRDEILRAQQLAELCGIFLIRRLVQPERLGCAKDHDPRNPAGGRCADGLRRVAGSGLGPAVLVVPAFPRSLPCHADNSPLSAFDM